MLVIAKRYIQTAYGDNLPLDIENLFYLFKKLGLSSQEDYVDITQYEKAILEMWFVELNNLDQDYWYEENIVEHDIIIHMETLKGFYAIDMLTVVLEKLSQQQVEIASNLKRYLMVNKLDF